ncbi:MAG: type II toxin-antitoxin system CcdA family antitoxin [Burkholderiales bacterium]|nr:type II toxin-antitoxin system CcdA family antitoxin [Nitrosomonas sp.]MCP5276012.1 type II toxin-antitoxin system CcdA family antitoxin [Burkholderiales bacterium]
MFTASKKAASKRRPVNLTIREDLLKTARLLNLNTSKAAEMGIEDAIRKAQASKWLESNKKALLAHNVRVEKEGTLLKPDWMPE